MKLSTLSITLIFIIAIYAVYRSFQAPQKSNTENFAYDGCVAEAVSKYDETMKYLASVEKECQSKGMCNFTNQEWLDAKAIGESNTFNELKKNKEICQTKYQ